jgi:hypothetical protein
MSRYTTYYLQKQQQYRELATTWKSSTAHAQLTERQRRGMALFFKPIARRFGLTQEFKSIGVI